jgi:hypothetical protein
MENTVDNTVEEQGSISVNENTEVTEKKEYVFSEEEFKAELEEQVGEGEYHIGPFSENGPIIKTDKKGYIDYVMALRKAAELWASTHQMA